MTNEPKGYVIARVTVSDPQAYAAYAKAAGEAQQKHGARVLARGGDYVALEAEARPRNVILEFDSLAKACYRSAEYWAARMTREGVAVAEIAVQGVQD